MESTHPFSVSFAPCFQAVLCRSQLFFRMFLDKLFQICADRFIMKQKRRCFSPFLLSPSSRRAWIEINTSTSTKTQKMSPSSRRAWIEIDCIDLDAEKARLSPSSRRAWIEIMSIIFLKKPLFVALLAEGVDRNHHYRGLGKHPLESPSSRRAWIEIFLPSGCWPAAGVALLAEGVDRNSATGKTYFPESSCRPPRGGRG